MPDAVHNFAQQYTSIWAERGVRAWEEVWWELSRKVGDKVALLMNAPVDTVTMQANVTSAEAILLSCFDFTQSRNKVVMIDREFPSLLYLYREWLSREGRLEIISCPDETNLSTEGLLQAIDKDTLLVSISHVLFRSSSIVDVEQIIAKAHSVGAKVILDVFQSLGTVPVDMQKLQVDFAVGGCLKWLCGGPGACFLYVRNDLQTMLTPRFTGWLAHENPFAFDNGTIRRTSGSYRFLNGTPVIPALYTCQPGLDIIAEVGIERIRDRSIEMTTYLLNAAIQRGWPAYTPIDSSRRGGTVAYSFPHAWAIATELNRRNFLVDYRPQAGIRLSPHFYTTNAELEETVMEIETILSDESYLKHVDSHATVT